MPATTAVAVDRLWSSTACNLFAAAVAAARDMAAGYRRPHSHIISLPVNWQTFFASTLTTAGRTGVLLTGLLLQATLLPEKLLVLAPSFNMLADAI